MLISTVGMKSTKLGLSMGPLTGEAVRTGLTHQIVGSAFDR